MVACAEKEPADVSPPGAIVRSVRITVMIRFLMVDAMGSDPEDRSAFERESTTDSKEIFQSEGDFVAAMGEQPMIAKTDAETDGHPIQENCYC